MGKNPFLVFAVFHVVLPVSGIAGRGARGESAPQKL